MEVNYHVSLSSCNPNASIVSQNFFSLILRSNNYEIFNPGPDLRDAHFRTFSLAVHKREPIRVLENEQCTLKFCFIGSVLRLATNKGYALVSYSNYPVYNSGQIL